MYNYNTTYFKIVFTVLVCDRSSLDLLSLDQNYSSVNISSRFDYQSFIETIAHFILTIRHFSRRLTLH